MRSHPGGRADLKLQHSAFLVKRFRSPAQFLAEELAQLTGDKSVINAHGTGLSTTPAKITSIAQLVQPGYCCPVKLNVSLIELCHQLAHGLDIFVNQSPEDFRAIGGTIKLVLAAGKIDRTGLPACLALSAIIEGNK